MAYHERPGVVPIRASTFPQTNPSPRISNQFIYEHGLPISTSLPVFTIDPSAEIIDLPDDVITTISPHALDHLFNLCSIRWGRRMPQPIPIDTIPDRFLTLMLPFEYRAHIGLSRLSPKVWIFIHVSNIHLGPTDRPFFVWKEGTEVFAFASQPGINFKGQYGPRKAITYLKAFMPIAGHIIPFCKTPDLATLKHKIEMKNTTVTNSLCKRTLSSLLPDSRYHPVFGQQAPSSLLTLDQITLNPIQNLAAIESPTKRRMISPKPPRLETTSLYDPTRVTNEGRNVVGEVIQYFQLGCPPCREYIHYPAQPEYLGELVIFLRRYLPSFAIQTRWVPMNDNRGPIQCIVITAKTSV